MVVRYILAILILFSGIFAAAQNKEELAQTPPMGWNSWNWHGKKNNTEQLIKETIDAICEKGLKKAGYEYVVIDGGWRATHLGQKGELLVDSIKFPNGIKYLADYAHAKGLKLGIHTVPGSHDCGGDKVGGFGNEEIQVQQFIDWGVDFIKLDKCKLASGWNEELLKETYQKWKQLLDKSGRNIILSISAYEVRDWYPEVGQMARTTYDISSIKFRGANFNKTKQGVYPIALQNNKASEYARPGFWNDADMLVTGGQGLTYEEEKTHFALWCIMSAPLMMGNDPRVSTEKELEILTNKKAISVNQNNLEQGKLILSSGDIDAWLKKLDRRKYALLLINTNDSVSQKINVPFGNLDLPKTVNVFDIYENKKLGKVSNEFTFDLQPHACRFLILKVSPSSSKSGE